MSLWYVPMFQQSVKNLFCLPFSEIQLQRLHFFYISSTVPSKVFKLNLLLRLTIDTNLEFKMSLIFPEFSDYKDYSPYRVSEKVTLKNNWKQKFSHGYLMVSLHFTFTMNQINYLTPRMDLKKSVWVKKKRHFK